MSRERDDVEDLDTDAQPAGAAAAPLHSSAATDATSESTPLSPRTLTEQRDQAISYGAAMAKELAVLREENSRLSTRLSQLPPPPSASIAYEIAVLREENSRLSQLPPPPEPSGDAMTIERYEATIKRLTIQLREARQTIDSLTATPRPEPTPRPTSTSGPTHKDAIEARRKAEDETIARLAAEERARKAEADLKALNDRLAPHAPSTVTGDSPLFAVPDSSRFYPAAAAATATYADLTTSASSCGTQPRAPVSYAAQAAGPAPQALAAAGPAPRPAGVPPLFLAVARQHTSRPVPSSPVDPLLSARRLQYGVGGETTAAGNSPIEPPSAPRTERRRTHASPVQARPGAESARSARPVLDALAESMTRLVSENKELPTIRAALEAAKEKARNAKEQANEILDILEKGEGAPGGVLSPISKDRAEALSKVLANARATATAAEARALELEELQTTLERQISIHVGEIQTLTAQVEGMRTQLEQAEAEKAYTENRVAALHARAVAAESIGILSLEEAVNVMSSGYDTHLDLLNTAHAAVFASNVEAANARKALEDATRQLRAAAAPGGSGDPEPGGGSTTTGGDDRKGLDDAKRELEAAIHTAREQLRATQAQRIQAERMLADAQAQATSQVSAITIDLEIARAQATIFRIRVEELTQQLSIATAEADRAQQLLATSMSETNRVTDMATGAYRKMEELAQQAAQQHQVLAAYVRAANARAAGETMETALALKALERTRLTAGRAAESAAQAQEQATRQLEELRATTAAQMAEAITVRDNALAEAERAKAEAAQAAEQATRQLEELRATTAAQVADATAARDNAIDEATRTRAEAAQAAELATHQLEELRATTAAQIADATTAHNDALAEAERTRDAAAQAAEQATHQIATLRARLANPPVAPAAQIREPLPNNAAIDLGRYRRIVADNLVFDIENWHLLSAFWVEFVCELAPNGACQPINDAAYSLFVSTKVENFNLGLIALHYGVGSFGTGTPIQNGLRTLRFAVIDSTLSYTSEKSFASFMSSATTAVATHMGMRYFGMATGGVFGISLVLGNIIASHIGRTEYTSRTHGYKPYIIAGVLGGATLLTMGVTGIYPAISVTFVTLRITQQLLLAMDSPCGPVFDLCTKLGLCNPCDAYTQVEHAAKDAVNNYRKASIDGVKTLTLEFVLNAERLCNTVSTSFTDEHTKAERLISSVASHFKKPADYLSLDPDNQTALREYVNQVCTKQDQIDLNVVREGLANIVNDFIPAFVGPMTTDAEVAGATAGAVLGAKYGFAAGFSICGPVCGVVGGAVGAGAGAVVLGSVAGYAYDLVH
jgi:hypothetical protein